MTCLSMPPRGAMTGFARFAVLAGAIVLSACVPVPIAQEAYVVESSEFAARSDGGGCAFNAAASQGYRKVGNVEVLLHLKTEHSGSQNARAQLSIGFSERSSSGRFSRVSVDPARIKLVENGRSLTARINDRQDQKYSNGTSRYSRTELVFPAPSGVAGTLQVLFEPGAIKLDGSSVPFAPVGFTLKETPMIYMFPCIPA